MEKYLLRVAYDGTAYAGWQQQQNALAVATVIERTFKHVFKHEVSVVGASRTDAGVHAYDQVVRLHTDLSIDHQRLLKALNNSLPHDVHVRSAVKCPDDFHPQFHVAFKEYWYHLFLARPLPFFARFGWQLPEYIHSFDISLFEHTLHAFEGCHDFTSFARVEEGYSPVRTVDSIRVEQLPRYNAVRVVVRGEGFLHFQVRRMVGAAVMVARDGAVVSYDDILHLLKNPQRTSPAFLNVPPQGLCLRKIVYKKDRIE